MTRFDEQEAIIDFFKKNRRLLKGTEIDRLGNLSPNFINKMLAGQAGSYWEYPNIYGIRKVLAELNKDIEKLLIKLPAH